MGTINGEALWFQSTLPRGERRRSATNHEGRDQFQSTLPRGERLREALARRAADCGFQSTLPRGERLDHDSIICLPKIVSIHAPAGGATSVRTVYRWISKFQSTLPRGERRLPRREIVAAVKQFQSTLPRGERRDAWQYCDLSLSVSIHAPAGGATSRRFSGHRRRTCFNPRSRGGSDYAVPMSPVPKVFGSVD